MKKGFTLLELLIVIGILAILATTATLVLNPGQLLAQARDAQRLGDVRSIHAAISMYLTTATSTIGFPAAATSTASCTTCTNGPTFTTLLRASSTITKVDGTGWIPVKLTDTLGGSPLSKYPTDPTNSGNYFYAFAADGSVSSKPYEIDVRLESDKYRDQMKDDGGDDSICVTYLESSCWYEMGIDPGLDL